MLSRRSKKTRIYGAGPAVFHKAGCAASVEVTNGTQMPCESADRLSGDPGSPSTNTSDWPAFGPVRNTFKRREAAVSTTTTKDSSGLSTRPFAK